LNERIERLHSRYDIVGAAAIGKMDQSRQDNYGTDNAKQNPTAGNDA